jgi:hypothetical protein
MLGVLSAAGASVKDAIPRDDLGLAIAVDVV